MTQQTTRPRKTGRRIKPTISAVLDEGKLLELVYNPRDKTTAFILWDGANWQRVQHFKEATGSTLVPYKATNALIEHRIVLFPSEPEEYGDEATLIAEIRAFIYRYVDVSERFLQIATYYVLLSWLYDAFNELPYLRLRGDYGSGKTRFLLIVGSLCYKPIFASGASTTSPIFHMLDAFGGTLIMDEGDFRFSDEKSDMVKILNNGNAKGMPVLRTEVSKTGEFNPRAFQVYGPKIVATRGWYQDRALESRFLTEEMGGRPLRSDIPITMDDRHHEEALQLRNKLLLYRFHTFAKARTSRRVVELGIEPRLSQIFTSLLSVVEDEEVRTMLRTLAHEYNRDMIAERSLDVEANVLQVIQILMARPAKIRISIKEITEAFIERFGRDYDRTITPKWIGGILRRKLQIKTSKSHGVYVISPSESVLLQRLYAKYGILTDTDSEMEAGRLGDFGDVAPHVSGDATIPERKLL